MTDQLHRHAEADTPSRVHVPDTMAGLLAWAAGRFGVAVIWAALACWGLTYVYRDLQALNERVLTAFVKQTETNAELVSTVRHMSAAIEKMNDRSVDK